MKGCWNDGVNGGLSLVTHSSSCFSIADSGACTPVSNVVAYCKTNGVSQPNVLTIDPFLSPNEVFLLGDYRTSTLAGALHDSAGCVVQTPASFQLSECLDVSVVTGTVDDFTTGAPYQIKFD